MAQFGDQLEKCRQAAENKIEDAIDELVFSLQKLDKRLSQAAQSTGALKQKYLTSVRAQQERAKNIVQTEFKLTQTDDIPVSSISVMTDQFEQQKPSVYKSV